MSRGENAQKRCAIYRKSSEEGLEQSFNSLHSQRLACEAFVKSQAGEGWRVVKTVYDDGGFSGATMERSALTQLLTHIREKRVDLVVVYKVDRLTRSLADFAKMVELFDAHGVSFVAVTQHFNTTTSMGRLTLNVLLSFAQFEREVTGERIRDKIAASKQKGMWMGGTVPLGYDVLDRRLVINLKEAQTVRLIFQLYDDLKSVRLVKEELDRRGIVSKTRVSKSGARSGGVRFGRGALYEMLANPIYVGEIRHRQTTHPGQHQPIVGRAIWRRIQEMLKEKSARLRGQAGGKSLGLLTGKLFDENGEPLYSCWAKKGDRRYRYLVSRKLIRGSNSSDNLGWRLPAEEMERAALTAARQMLSDRGSLASALRGFGLAASEVKHALDAIALKAKSMEEGESNDTLRTLIERVDLKRERIQINIDLKALMPLEIIPRCRTNLRVNKLMAMQIKRRGVETRLVFPGGATPMSQSDPALLRAVARGYQWFGELASGRAFSARQIARREGLSHSYVRHVVPLGLIAPKIVEAICVGHQPTILSAERLKNHADLPIHWNEQQQILIGS